MIARPKPEVRPDPPSPDDGPETYRTTPRRVSAQIRDRSIELSGLAIRLRELAACTATERADRIVQALTGLAGELSSLSIDVLHGRVALREELLDKQHRPERPLIDLIEAAPVNRLADQVAPAIAARGDTAEGFLDHHGCNGCEPAAARPGRKKTRATKGGVS